MIESMPSTTVAIDRAVAIFRTVAEPPLALPGPL